ncbi:MAG: bifunctional diguanylate cyclase/phosphodiesterase [Candidatus Devosia phytovorans]|uniref:Bifunctional diguanylate cyclase/phosphodiesterase n=1 Tax=Candidatus Devosia phytovorans TaxID=3121372 RepID=A0AAJ6AYZ6_9HYPH|nr:bifunctional diguanylate cyclase/phosphodiesterase [Devosia sp.]WEK03231.1 MAG: bifunctional diguanylate cyclase/phosphodiesterase [Devosia sp.]
MNRNDEGAATNTAVLVTAVARIDPDEVIVTCNASAEATVLGAHAVSHRLSVKLSEAVKFGRIGKVGLSQFKSAAEAKSGVFHLNDGRMFLLHATIVDGWKQLEWTDVSRLSSASALREPVTGLYNRHGFAEALSRRSPGSTQMLLRLVVDSFGKVRDQLGQLTADHFVCRIADRIASRIDPAGVHLAHFGNGEFLMVIDEAGEAVALDMLDLLSRPYLVDGGMIHCSVSIGMVAAPDVGDIDEELRNAGLALQQARLEGGNSAQPFTASMRHALERRNALEFDLRKALALGKLSLVYQPQYRIEGHKLVGFEALLRWDREAGPVSPADFIPLAEELGLIVPIGEWVLRTACLQAANWPGHITISVNVSPVQFRSPGIVTAVAAAINNARLDPSRLDLEVTEGALLANSAAIMDVFHQLKILGVKFSMDDFGTGYSSLSYLQRFPFDKIKIDQSFVRRLPDRDSRAIIRAVCALGKSLGMATIAEGVETEDQLSQVKKKGCQQVQGYLTGRPMTPDMADLLAAGIELTSGER